MMTVINKRYALFFGISSVVVMLVLVSSFAFLMAQKGEDFKKNIKAASTEFYRETHGKTLFNTAQFLSQHLYVPLDKRDMTTVDDIISDMKAGLPYISFVVADQKGRILTDGTFFNFASGRKLNVSLARLKNQPIIVETTEQGERITFAVRSKLSVAGYGQLVYSKEPLLVSIEKLHGIFDSGWTSFRSVFLRIILIGVAAALIVGGLLSFVFSNAISRPLLQLKNAADRVAQGDLDCRVDIESRDELGKLAASFNTMVTDLKRSTEELREANRRLHESAITDGLTGLSNYAYFIDELHKEEARATRSASNFSVIILDLDDFKKVNDTCGHEKGNLLLKAVADIIKANARSMDTVARYGGEEFAVLMPDSNGSERDVAERIRKKIESAQFAGIAETPVRITISGGVSSFPRDARSVHELLEKADKRLYHAKNGGRNRTCVSETAC